eukprot:jgi/Botrbrau1/15656/Bobra.4_1s0040.1
MFYGEGRLGLLFHSAEYPRQSPAFPVHLGFCQQGSSLAYSEEAMNWRNLLYYAGGLWSLDLSPEGPLYSTLLMDGLQDFRTLLEDDFGDSVCDVHYFHSLSDRKACQRIFISTFQT